MCLHGGNIHCHSEIRVAYLCETRHAISSERAQGEGSTQINVCIIDCEINHLLSPRFGSGLREVVKQIVMMMLFD